MQTLEVLLTATLVVASLAMAAGTARAVIRLVKRAQLGDGPR